VADARRRLDPLDAVAGLAVVAWLGWVIAAAILTGRSLPLTSPYVVAPLVGVAGVVAGRLAARHAHAWHVPAALAIVGAGSVIGYLITPGPGKLPLRYMNANAALGVQLLALAALSGLAGRLTQPAETLNRWLPHLALVSALGLVLVNRSQAGSLVAIPVVLVAVWVSLRQSGPPKALTFFTALLSLIGAGAAGLWISARPTLPPPLLKALDPARKQLWDDAVAVWRTHPVTGGGPGAFAENSLLAVDPDTSTAHSALLQVGSELGVIGVALFAVLLIVGLLLAVRGDRAAALVGAAAWTALGIHSFVDHLYEFPAVTLAAAMVLGWASGQNSSTSPSVSRHADGRGGDAASGRVVSKGPIPRNGTGISPAEGPVRRPMA